MKEKPKLEPPPEYWFLQIMKRRSCNLRAYKEPNLIIAEFAEFKEMEHQNNHEKLHNLVIFFDRAVKNYWYDVKTDKYDEEDYFRIPFHISFTGNFRGEENDVIRRALDDFEKARGIEVEDPKKEKIVDGLYFLTVKAKNPAK